MQDVDFYKRIDDQNLGCQNQSELYEYLESKRSSLPFIEQIETTNACDGKCVMCPRGQGFMTRKIGVMPMQVYKKIIDELSGIFPYGYIPDYELSPIEQTSRHYFAITGLRLHHFGEPLLDPMLCERIRYSKFVTHFSANPTKLYPETSRKLINAGLRTITIALDGMSDDEYKAIRGPHVDYDKAVNNIFALLDLREQLNWPLIIDMQLVSMTLNQESAPQFQKFWQDNGINVLVKDFFPYPDVNHKFKVEGQENFFKGCIMPFISMTILQDGTVVPCHSDYNGEIVLGNVQEKPLYEIWNSEPYQQFRKKFVLNQLEEGSLCHRCGFYGHGEFFRTYKGSGHYSTSNNYNLQEH